MPHRILLCTDDISLARSLHREIEQKGYRVNVCRTGAAALQLLQQEDFSLLLLDLLLPDMDGFEVCRRLRLNCHIPIIMLSARGEEIDCIIGLEIGADDFVPRPISPRELAARIAARLRRCGHMFIDEGGPASVLQFGDITLDLAQRQVLRHGQLLHLTPKEFALLAVLAENRGSVVRSSTLLMRVWGYDANIRTRTLDVHIGRLRAKIEPQPHHPRYIITVPGVGYKLCIPEKFSEAA